MMKADIIAAATGKFTEPKHSGLIYTKMELVRALNHYNIYAKPESLKIWALTYLKKHHPELVVHVNQAPMSVFGTYGALCRMAERGFDFSEEHKERIYRHFSDVAGMVKIAKATPKIEIIKPAPKKTYTRSREAFEIAIDETLATGKLVLPSLIMTESHKDIAEICQQNLKDIEEAPEYFGSTVSLQKKFYKQVLEKVEKTKAAKKASTTYISKNPAKQVAGVKYKFKDEELGLRSIDPVDTVERKKMYVYDAKYRRLIVFVSLTAAGFQYTGTTLKNVDLKKSFSKTIRKPEEFFKKTKLGISDLNKAFEEIKAKPTPMIASRFNTDWLILKVTEKGA